MSRLGQHNDGHEGVITGSDGFSLRSTIADPKESPSLHSNQLIYIVYVLTNIHNFWWMNQLYLFSLISEK
ncbi:hypothetical protein LSPCS325_05730 [Lysinibacillus sp. CTST325]